MMIEPTIQHSRSITEYTIDNPKLQFHNKRGRFNCWDCERKIEVGDRVVSKVITTTKIYCKKCALELKII